jgi:hypothetical protein
LVKAAAWERWEERVAENGQLKLDLYPETRSAPKGRTWIRTPYEHGELVHGSAKGLVAIAHKTEGERWREQVRSVEVALEILRGCRGRENIYLSTQRFRGRRRIAYLLSLSELYADLDYYRKPGLVGADPYRVLELALKALKRAELPDPSLSISSGRGLYLLWLHGPIARSALPRWASCQREICKALAHLGADALALDAARVLRVVGTRHGGSGAMVEAVTPVGEISTFDQLADEILPFSRAELRDIRVQRALRRARSPSTGPQTPPEGFTSATLWEARLSDLQRLKALRWFGDPMPDFRDRWLFVAGVGMSWLAVPQVLRRELFALAREVGGWTERETRSKLHAIFRTAHEAAAGRRVEWQGLEIDPRYRMRNQTIIEALEITPEEEREMTTLISDDERRRRDRQRKNPVMSRQEYEGRAADRRSQARRMAAEGVSRQQIARALGWSKRHVQRVLNQDTRGG